MTPVKKSASASDLIAGNPLVLTGGLGRSSSGAMLLKPLDHPLAPPAGIGLASTMRQVKNGTHTSTLAHGKAWNDITGKKPTTFRALTVNAATDMPVKTQVKKMKSTQSDKEKEKEAEEAAQKAAPPPRPAHLDKITTMYLGSPEVPDVAEGDEAGLAAAEAAAAESAQMAADLDALLNNMNQEVDVADLLEMELAKIRTGEDAIAFFAKNGSATSVKLLYCNRVQQTDVTFAPYDLIVVPEDQINVEYFTISTNGIVYICPGQLSEYISLMEWMHQSLMYSVLTSMTFFKYYIHRKVFIQWQMNARYAVYCHHRVRLSRSCFLAKPLFVEPLVQVHGLIQEVEEVRVMLLTSASTTCYHVTEFADMQTQVRSNPVNGAQKDLEQKHDAGVSILDRLIQTVNRSIESEPLSIVQNANNKSKSMVQEKNEARERARHQRIARMDASLLGDCIRLVDYMFQAALVTVVVKATVEFSGRLEISSKLFSIAVGFGEDKVTLDPPREKFVETFQQIWDGTINVVNSVPPFTSVRQYEQYTHPPTNKPLTVREVIVNNYGFKDYTSRITENISKQIDDTQAYANEQYEPHRKIFEYGREWDEQAFLEQEHTFQSLQPQMEAMRQFQEDLDKQFRAHNVLGIISIDGKALKGELVPIPENALLCMKKILTGMARDRCFITLQRYDTVNKALDERPKELSRYATYAKMYQMVMDERAEMEEMMEDVETMYHLMKDYNVKLPFDDEHQLDKLTSMEQEFTHKKTLEARLHLDEQQAEMGADCQARSSEIEEKMIVLNEELGKGAFIDAEKIPFAHEVLEELDRIGEKQMKMYDERASTFSEYEDLLQAGTPKFEFTELEKCKATFAEKMKLWEVVAQWLDFTHTWNTSDFLKNDVELMNKQVSSSARIAQSLTKTLKGDEVVARIKVMVDEWREKMPAVLELGNPAMRPRHWEKLFKKINLPWKGPNSVTSMSLSMLEANGIFDHKEFIAEVSANASGEFALEQSLEQVIQAWEGMILPIMNHRNQKDLWILADMAEIITLCEDHGVTVSTMMGSRFVQGIREKIEIWEKKINLASDVIDEWYQVQRAWMYLENIFSAEDIQAQLPTEAGKFKQVDKFWKDVFRKVRQSFKLAMDAFHIPDLLPKLKWANDSLEEIQKKLEAYLETKRAAFPRFYFLSNDELLGILSQTRNPHAVQEHLCKCFDAISRVEFSKENPAEIIAMTDMIKERVGFVEPVVTGGAVEKWLNEIETAMVSGLWFSSEKCLKAYPEDGSQRTEWLFGDYSSQSILMVDQINWTLLAEQALNLISSGQDEDAMKKNIEFTKLQLANSVSIVRMDLTKLMRVMMGALIVLDVHGISVLESLVEVGCRSANDFDWSKQLRYEWVIDDWTTSTGLVANNDCVCKQTIASFKYAHEYLGNTPRLVVTPLTDKCYMTLTNGMHLYYGGAPAGPAGTGKTETTKDLGKALAVPVIVFNCSDGLDYKIMGRFFSGLSQAGAWACFDEFNRIQVEVLSVIAQQMLTITQAIRGRKEIFEFLGKDIPLNPRFGVFITMNPGYAGRAELPDNLKALFRPVAMMVPDYGLIAEIILYSEGFNGAKDLARKMVNLYRLSSEQLSKQDHYDFGMRAVKSVLVMAGHLKRAYPDLEENVTLIRALRDSNVPKFLSFDLPLFSGIISDLYPDVSVPFSDYGDLMKEIENQLRLMKLQIVPSYITKITQLLETQLVRHGVMLVGTTMTGKSTNSTILSKTLTQLRKDGSTDASHQLCKVFHLNPKSITIEELYGSFNDNTGEWKDGLVAILVREAVSDTSDNKKWINFDGPVDAIWIENMNTVLDDNKMLCLANGERIKLPGTMCIMFEVNDLAVASPATVSRCGMVYLEPVHLGWKPLISTWAEKFQDRYPKYAENLGKWVLQICEDALPFIREECQEAPGLPSQDNNLVQSYLRMLTAFISDGHQVVCAEEGKPTKSDEDEAKLVEMYCALCAIWSLGANLHENSRKKFIDFLRPKLKKFCETVPSDTDLYMSCVSDEDVKFQSLRELVPTYTYDPNEPFFNILVPTAETTGQRLLVENLMSAGFHALFSGETGVGKSVGIQQFLNTAGELYSTAGANFSAQTSSTNVVDMMENRLERKRKNLLGAPPGTVMIMFIDDLNMPMLENYGAQPPIELLRQVIDYHGFYDQKKLFWKHVQDVQFIAACGPPGGGRMVVTPRLFRHFNMIWMPALSQEAMNRILSSILGGWLGHVKPDLQDLAVPMVKASVDVYNKLTSDLLPTPIKCHYTFNLRDPAKMIQGMLMVDVVKALTSSDDLIRLYMHESCRQFRDRLIDDVDREWFNELLAKQVSKHTGKNVVVDSFRDTIFGDFWDRDTRSYNKADSEEQCVNLFNEWLDDYNVTYPTKMNIVFFRDACFHLARASRTVRQPRGNLLLVGVSGVGRKCCARMAAHMADFQCYSIEITRTYGPNEFKEDLKNMMNEVAKSGGKGMMFLFSDMQIVKESFLEDVNNILNTGEVPNLFAADEAEQIVGLMRGPAKAAGKETRDGIWQHFVQCIRENLHIALAMSPIGEGFRARCRQFPSLINCTSIDWYNAWPVDALTSVAERYYGAVPEELGIKDIVPQLSKMSGFMHKSSQAAAEDFFERLRRRTYMTPTSYLELIGLFTTLLTEKKGELQVKLNRYVVGAKTLTDTKTVVDELKSSLTEMQPVIEKAKIDTAELMVKVQADQVIAAEKSAACAVDEKAAAEAAAEANEIKTDCQNDLDQALPEYNAAVKSLDALDKKDIQEVKSFAKPPPLVEVVLSAVCLLMGQKETWDEAKKLMNKSSFLDDLKTYDKDALTLNTKLTGKLQKYMKRDDFQPAIVKNVSNAAMSLCSWVRAMDIYSRVAREIEPKKEKLKGAEASLAAAQEKLAIAKAELKVVLDNVAALEAKLETAKAKSEQLERDANDCVVKLDRAEKLLAGLGNESIRWTAASAVLEKNLKFVIGNMLAAGGFISYVGPFTAEFRKDLVDQWIAYAKECELTTDPSWKCADVLVDPAEVRGWNICGLPADDLSVENGIMVTRGRRWPLMIDPQGQANRWIRRFGKDKGVTVTKLTDGTYLRKLEAGIRAGTPVLIENVEEVLDPAIEPVLTKAIVKRGGQMVLRLGDTDVPYDENFALSITTKMANPHYLPEICIKVTIINFTVTLLGLEDQLVAEVVANENPELAAKRTELVVQIAADKKEMDDLEQLILKLLADAGGDVLKDDSLIVTLDQSKKTGDECKDRTEIAEKAMIEINEVTETLRPVATRASILYFVIADLGRIDPMYQYSLEYFVGLFQNRLRESEKSDDVLKRITIILNDFTRFMYLNICRGLFEDHKMLFSFLVCVQILRVEVHAKYIKRTPIPMAEWLFFLRGIESGKGSVPDERPDGLTAPDWVIPLTWGKLDMLERFTCMENPSSYEGLMKAVNQGQEWEKFITNDALNTLTLPGGWSKKLTPFQQMLVKKSCRENLGTLVARDFISAELGEFFTQSPPFDLEGCFNDSKNTSPLIFILSAGADPTEYLLTLANNKGYGDKLHFISLGQGQGPKAEKLVQFGQDAGEWVCLQNCHLAASWMGKLEQIQEAQDADKINQDYRLWLTSMPSPKFPVPVLQGGVKITNEPPKGLRANLGRTFQDITEEGYEACAAKPMYFKKMLYGLAIFHAVILERRKFGPIGWNIPYEWMDSDFQVSREQVRLYLISQDQVPWVTLQYLIAEVNYGGRVTDDKDVRLISAVLKGYFAPEMFDDTFRFAKLPDYSIPKDGSLTECREFLTKLPVDEDPRIFGLHPNALITAQFNQARTFLDTVISVQPRIASGGSGKKPEEIVDEMAEHFLKAIPEGVKKKAAHPNTYKKTAAGGIISIGVFHGQEYERTLMMITVIKNSLKMLGKAIKGIVLMSADMEEMYNAFLVQKVPGNWSKIAYPCMKPLNSWVEDFVLRIGFMVAWLTKGPPNSFWISSFFFPQGFMTAALQLHARKTKIPIDMLDFHPVPGKEMDPDNLKGPPENGVNIHGLFLQGSGWTQETQQLRESDQGILFVPMPIILLSPEMVAGIPKLITDQNLYKCPMYKTSERKGTLSTTGHSTNFVKYFAIGQPEKDADHWTARGVAMLCMLDD
jgi:dynein heavy chain